MSKDTNFAQVLYVACDDSNHHGDDRTGDIIVGVFSLGHEDSLYRDFPKKRNYADVENWLNNQDVLRDFRYTFLEKPALRFMQPTVPLVAPRLILACLPCLDIDLPKKINICIDGLLPKAHKQYIRDYLGHYFQEVTVTNVIKRRGEMAKRSLSKKLHCPTTLKMADVLANHIYGSPQEFLDTPKRVNVNEDRLLELMVSLR